MDFIERTNIPTSNLSPEDIIMLILLCMYVCDWNTYLLREGYQSLVFVPLYPLHIIYNTYINNVQLLSLFIVHVAHIYSFLIITLGTHRDRYNTIYAIKR